MSQASGNLFSVMQKTSIGLPVKEGSRIMFVFIEAGNVASF